MVSGPSQAQSPGDLQIHISPCSLWVSGHAVGSWCGILLAGVLCSSLCFPAPAECSAEAISLCDQGRIAKVPSKAKVVTVLSNVCVY